MESKRVMSPRSHRMVAAMMKPMPGTLWIRARVGARSAWLWMFCRRARLSCRKVGVPGNDLVDELPGRKPVRGALSLGSWVKSHFWARSLSSTVGPSRLFLRAISATGCRARASWRASRWRWRQSSQLADGFLGHVSHREYVFAQKPGQEKPNRCGRSWSNVQREAAAPAGSPGRRMRTLGLTVSRDQW